MPYQKTYRRPITRNNRLKKRWYIGGTLGNSVPIIGGSSFHAGTSPLTKRSLNAVKSMIKDSGTTKNKVINVGTIANFLHDTMYTFNPLGNITIGTGENARLGTDINVKHINFRIRLTQRTDLVPPYLNAPVFVRMAWVRTNVQVLASQDTFGSGLGASSLFLDGQNSGQLSTFDKDKVTVLNDMTFQMPITPLSFNSTTNTVIPTVTSKIVDFPCPAKDFVFKYGSTTSGYSVVNKNVYLVVIPFLYGTSVGSTILLDYSFTSNTQFTDSR